MNFKLIGTLLFFLAWSAPALSCPVGSSLWCSSVDIAKSCGVEHACFKHVWQKKVTHVAASPVKLDLFYESLCPYSIAFINEQLYPTYQKIGDIMKINLIPFGNAKVSNGSNGYQFQCQHGPQECVGNKYETCAIAYLADIDKYFPFINCMELNANSQNMMKVAQSCATQTSLAKNDFKAIDSCAKGPMGTQLELQMAQKTKQATVSYVPWVVLNGIHNEQEQQAAQTDLLKLVCDTYKGTKPAACQKELTVTTL